MHASLVLILTEVIGLSSAGIALAIWPLCSFCACDCGIRDDPFCACGDKQTMSHIVNECPLTKYLGGLQALHTADEDLINWLQNTTMPQGKIATKEHLEKRF